jgi:hypothetical protein
MPWSPRFALERVLHRCGIGQPPVMTLEQWEAERNRVRSSSD